MSAQVISLRRYDSAPAVTKKPIDLSYEKSFIKQLLFWMAIGTVMALVLPYWAITLICIGMVYLDGKLKQRQEHASTSTRP